MKNPFEGRVTPNDAVETPIKAAPLNPDASNKKVVEQPSEPAKEQLKLW